MFMYVACAGIDVLPDEIFGEVKSRRTRFHPGSRWTRTLKYESLTGQHVAGKRPWWWLTVSEPSSGF
jgi:hypothetical protein